MQIDLQINVDMKTGKIRIYYPNGDYLVIDDETGKWPVTQVVCKALQIEETTLSGIIDGLGYRK